MLKLTRKSKHLLSERVKLTIMINTSPFRVSRIQVVYVSSLLLKRWGKTPRGSRWTSVFLIMKTSQVFQSQAGRRRRRPRLQRRGVVYFGVKTADGAKPESNPSAARSQTSPSLRCSFCVTHIDSCWLSEVNKTHHTQRGDEKKMKWRWRILPR